MNKVFAVVIWIIGLAMMITLPLFCDTGFAIRLGLAFAFSVYCTNKGNSLWENAGCIKHNPPEEDEE